MLKSPSDEPLHGVDGTIVEARLIDLTDIDIRLPFMCLGQAMITTRRQGP